jgi:hypothetical protein
MRIFISGETDADIGDAYRKLIMEIGPKLKILCGEKSYGEEILEIAIIPTIFSPKTSDVLQYKERKRYSPKTRAADFRLRIDHQKFKDADEDGKRKLILQNIIDSIRILKTKVKKGFEGDKLEEDIRRLFDYRE